MPGEYIYEKLDLIAPCSSEALDEYEMKSQRL